MLLLNDNTISFIKRGTLVGTMRIVPHAEYDYCDYIEIFKEYRGNGFATQMIEEYMSFSKKPLRFSVVSENCGGVLFWTEFCKTKVVRRVKGLTFEILA